MLSAIAPSTQTSYVYQSTGYLNSNDDFTIVSFEDLLASNNSNTTTPPPAPPIELKKETPISTTSEKKRFSVGSSSASAVSFPDLLLSPLSTSGKSDASSSLSTRAKSVSDATSTTIKTPKSVTKSNRPPITPTFHSSSSRGGGLGEKTNANTVALLKTKNISSKVLGSKRPCFTDSDFPPVALANSTTHHHGGGNNNNGNSGKKLHSNSTSSNNLSALNLNASQSYNTSFHKYLHPSSALPTVSSDANVVFVPMAITPEEMKQSTHQQHLHYIRADLQLEEIITQVDYVLKSIAEGSQDPTAEAYKHYSSSTFAAYHTIYQQMYVYYNILEHSWRLLYSQAAEHCEVKIRMFRYQSSPPPQQEEDEQMNPEVPETNSIVMNVPLSPAVSSSFSPRHVVSVELIDGDLQLFTMIFQQLKQTIGTMEDCWAKDVTVSLQSKCLLMSPQDYYYEQHKKSDPLASVSSSVSAASISGFGRNNSSDKLVLSTSGKYSEKEGINAMSMTEFYEDPTNIAMMHTWTDQILQYDSPLEQHEAIKSLCHVVHSAHHEKRMFDLLESFQLVENLMAVFVPSHLTNGGDNNNVTNTASLPTSMGMIQQQEEDIFWIKPYIIQILLYFTDRVAAVKTMLNDKYFIDFITTVTSTFQQQQEQLALKMNISQKMMSATPTIITTTSMQLQWLKLYKDCYRLSEELAKMIGTGEEDEEIGMIRHTTSAEDYGWNMFSPLGGNNNNHNNSSLKSFC